MASILRDHGPLAATDAVDLALDVCDELANAHVNGVVHGDLGLHRVRTFWPRIATERVEIFALGENDSAAFAFRASSIGALVSPEQRDGRAVDVRADVWAVGAMLHWMISGVAPTSDPITLAMAPRTLVIAIASCLADDPARRPQSVGELAEILSSFSAAPVERFEQLARRRASLENAERARRDLTDVTGALSRLDDAALARELASATPADAAAERLMFAVHRTTGGAAFDAPLRVTEHHDNPPPSNGPNPPSSTGAPERVHSVLPLMTTSPILNSALLAPAPVTESIPPSAQSIHPHAPRTSPWTMALGLVGAIAAVGLGAGIGIQVVERLTAPSTASSPTGVTTVTNGTMPRPAEGSGTVTPAALPDVRPTTPASLPDAKPHRRRTARPKPSATTTGSSVSASASEGATPKGFKPLPADPEPSADATE